MGGSSDDDEPGDDIYATSVARRIPCGQVQDCFELCMGDQPCIDECYFASSEEAQALTRDIDACYVENGCTDPTCTSAQCGPELEVCNADVSEGGVICFSEGFYEVCDLNSGICETRSSAGAAWGADEEAAGFWANYDCQDHMLVSVILNGIDSTTAAAQVQSCAPYECAPND
jgi:hypothetical protein